MKIDEVTARINELYHKKNTVGLTEEEAKERKELFQIYIGNIRAGMQAQLNSIDIQEEDGSITNLGEKYGGVKNEN